jgi:hypothetical protein
MDTQIQGKEEWIKNYTREGAGLSNTVNYPKGRIHGYMNMWERWV